MPSADWNETEYCRNLRRTFDAYAAQHPGDASRRAIDLNPFGQGKFSALITLTDGTARYEDASGYLQIRGTLDFATGAATGDYHGQVCTGSK